MDLVLGWKIFILVFIIFKFPAPPPPLSKIQHTLLGSMLRDFLISELRTIQFFVLPSVTRECNPKILELFYLFQCRSIPLQRALIRFLERRRTSVLAELIFISAISCASAKLFNARRRPDSVVESRTNSSAKSRQLILQFPIVATVRLTPHACSYNK